MVTAPSTTASRSNPFTTWLIIGLVVIGTLFLVVSMLDLDFSSSSTNTVEEQRRVEPSPMTIVAPATGWSQEIPGVPGMCIDWSKDHRVKVESLTAGQEGKWLPHPHDVQRPTVSVKFQSITGAPISVSVRNGYAPTNGTCL